MESIARQPNDAPLILDELKQVDGKVAGEIAYMLANGLGKRILLLKQKLFALAV